MRPLRRAAVSSLLVIAACADAPPPEVHTGVPEVVEVPKATPVAAAPILAAPVLPPLAADKRDPCDVARTRRSRAADFLAKGRAMRALGELAAADRLCAADAAQGSGTKQSARDAMSPAAGKPVAGSLLLTNAFAAKARGDAMAASKLFDQALVRLEEESASKPSILWGREAEKALALSADGATAVLGLGTTAVLADAARLTPIRFFDHSRAVVAATFSHDGKLVATIDESGDAFLWATATGKKLYRFTWSGEPATIAAFTIDNKQLIVLGAPSFNSAVRVWSTATGDSVSSFAIEGTSRPTTIAIARDGKLAAFGSERGHVEIWSLGPKPKRAFVLANKESFLESSMGLAFSPKGDRLASTFENGTTTVWDTANGKPVWETSQSAFFLKLGAYTFSVDGKRLLAGWFESSAGGSVRVWDAVAGTELQNTHVSGRVVAFSDDVKRGLLEGSSSVALLDLVAMSVGTAHSTDEAIVDNLMFGPPRVVAMGFQRDESLRVLLPTGIRSLPLGESFRMVAPTIDGKEIAVSIHGAINLWDLDSAKPREQIDKLDLYPDSIAVAPDGTVRATGSSEGLSILSSSPGRAGWKQGFNRPRGSKSFPKLSLSEFGRSALLVEDNEITVVDIDSSRALPIVHGLKRWSSAELSADGRIVQIVAGEAIHRFDATTGERLGPPFPFDCFSPATAISFDGARVAFICETIARVITFGDHDKITSTQISLGQAPHRFALSPHGDLLVTASSNGRLQLYRVSDSRPLGNARFLPGQDAALLETADGRIEIVGAKKADLEQELWCRLGAEAYPFDLCRDAMTDDGLLNELLAAP